MNFFLLPSCAIYKCVKNINGASSLTHKECMQKNGNRSHKVNAI